MTGRATSNRVPWLLFAAIVAVSFAGLAAAAHFAHAGAWYYAGWFTGCLSVLAVVAWDERERRR
jgi:hypothetical protein